MTSGIYQIRNRENGRVYLGSTSSLRQRWMVHRSSLRGGYHFNQYLQRAWDKYGEQAFVFEVLEHCPIDQPREHEQAWLDATPNNYNLAVVTDAPMRGRRMSLESRRLISQALTGHKRSKAECEVIGQRSSRGYPAFIHTTGKEIPAGHNLRSMCREHGLEFSYSTMGSVARGQAFSCKGWMLKSKARLAEDGTWSVGYLKSSRASYYPAFVNLETGEIIEEGKNLKALCERKGLSAAHMAAVAGKYRRTCQGWALLESAWLDENGNWQTEHKSAGSYPALINGDGRVIPAGRNVSRLCRKLGLTRAHLCQVIKGERNHHKGWRIHSE